MSWNYPRPYLLAFFPVTPSGAGMPRPPPGEMAWPVLPVLNHWWS
jgi:hypothetical protein